MTANYHFVEMTPEGMAEYEIAPSHQGSGTAVAIPYAVPNSLAQEVALFRARKPCLLHGDQWLADLLPAEDEPAAPAILHVTAPNGRDPVGEIVSDLDYLYSDKAALDVYHDETGFNWLLTVEDGLDQRHLNWLDSVGATYTYTA
jgi:hypothetical protein